MGQDETDTEEIIAFMNAFAKEILPLIAEYVFGVVIVPPLPKIEDYMPEARRKRQLEAIYKSMRRQRRLLAEDMLNIYLLHKKKACFISKYRQTV
jgi:hypothetical protein